MDPSSLLSIINNSRLDSILKKFAGLRNLLLLFALIVVFNFLLFPLFMPKGQDVIPLDLFFYYDPEKAYEMILLYGETGRDNYLKGILLLDYIYPVVYALFLGLAIYMLYRKPTPALLPVPVLVSDYLENTGIVLMLTNYPNELTAVAWLTGFITTMKWIMAGISVLAILLKLSGRLKIRNISA